MSYGISIDKDTNTNIIVDNILSWAKSLKLPSFTWSVS
jgi:hypothetical protein